jgi:hypothetical protein
MQKPLEAARYITHPIQLLSLTVIGLILIAYFVSSQTAPITNAEITAILILIVVALFLFAAIFIFRGTAISNAGQDSRDFLRDSDDAPPDALPTELILPNELYHHIAPALEVLGFTTQQRVEGAHWGKTYYFSEAERANERIALISLDRSFFGSGPLWSQKRWLGYIVSVFRTRPTHLAIVSETTVICQEAHYEIDDVKRDYNVDVVFLTKIILDALRASQPDDNARDLKHRLRLA